MPRIALLHRRWFNDDADQKALTYLGGITDSRSFTLQYDGLPDSRFAGDGQCAAPAVAQGRDDARRALRIRSGARAGSSARSRPTTGVDP